MAETFVTSASRVEKWRRKYFSSAVRALPFYDYMGSDENKVIQVDKSLEKGAGEAVNFPLIGALTGDPIVGGGTARGNEEPLSNFNHKIETEWYRKPVMVNKKEEQATEVDLREGGRVQLKNYSVRLLRGHILDEMFSPVIGGGTTYAAASEANKDAWVAANLDRIGWGASGYAGSDHSAGLLGLDTTNDKLTVANVRSMRRRLINADPLITPVTIDGKGEFYVAFVCPMAMTDLRNSAETIHKDGGVRGRDNPLFSPGDLLIEGIIFREVPELDAKMSSLTGTGASSAQTCATFVCGAQALGIAWTSMPDIVVDSEIDYKFGYGACHQECRGVSKFFYNSKQHGMFTYYTATSEVL